MRVFGYCRVSTQRQVDEGESLEVQRRQIEGHASIQGWAEVEMIVEEGVSGSKPLKERPAGKKMLDALKPGDVLIAAKLDRLFRSALDALNMVDDFKKRGVHLHLIDLGGDVASNGLGKVFLTIAASFAEAERDRIRTRVADAKADMRRRQRHMGGSRPFGWTLIKAKDENGKDEKGHYLAPHPEEQAAIERMKSMRASGETFRSIAKAMRDEGFDISHTGVSRVLSQAE